MPKPSGNAISSWPCDSVNNRLVSDFEPPNACWWRAGSKSRLLWHMYSCGAGVVPSGPAITAL